MATGRKISPHRSQNQFHFIKQRHGSHNQHHEHFLVQGHQRNLWSRTPSLPHFLQHASTAKSTMLSHSFPPHSCLCIWPSRLLLRLNPEQLCMWCLHMAHLAWHAMEHEQPSTKSHTYRCRKPHSSHIKTSKAITNHHPTVDPTPQASLPKHPFRCYHLQHHNNNLLHSCMLR